MHVVTTPDRTSLTSFAPAVVVGAVSIVLIGTSLGATGAMVTATLTVAGFAAFVDVRLGRIPNSLVLMAGAPPLIAVALSAAAGHGVGLLVDMALGGLLFAGPLFMLHLVSPDALGFGDVKLAAVLGAALGAVEPRLGVLALCLAAGSAAATGLVGRRDSVPFGPGLVLGVGLALLVGMILGDAAVAWH